MKMRPRAHWGLTRWVRMAILLTLVSVSAVFAREYRLSGLFGIAAGILALLSVLRPRLELREHGLRFESAFVLWNSISRYSWSDLQSGSKVLSLEGAWLFPKQMRVTEEQSGALDSLISGASRFEPSTPLHRAVVAVVSMVAWSAVVALLVLALQWLEQQYGPLLVL